MKPRYRIVTDCSEGFTVEVWRWWWPFWLRINRMANTHGNQADARNWLARRIQRREFRPKLVAYLGESAWDQHWDEHDRPPM